MQLGQTDLNAKSAASQHRQGQELFLTLLLICSLCAAAEAVDVQW